MKKLSFLVLAMLSLSVVQAQKIMDKAVPEALKSVVKEKYPDCKALKWEREYGNYEAAFEVDETDHAVLLDKAGNILETEVEIKVEVLPAAARAYITQNYKGKKIREAARITDARGTVTYEAEISGKDLIFDHEGKFLKETNG